MAIISEDDDLFYGLRGKWGDWVFRRVYGKTIRSRRPRKQDPAQQSEGRKNARSKFKRASTYAMEVRQDPEKKAYYTKMAKEWGLTNDYIAAIRDYMRNPDIARSQTPQVNENAKATLQEINPNVQVCRSNQKHGVADGADACRPWKERPGPTYDDNCRSRPERLPSKQDVMGDYHGSVKATQILNGNGENLFLRTVNHLSTSISISLAPESGPPNRRVATAPLVKSVCSKVCFTALKRSPAFGPYI
jgi:hypothetical protein